MLAAPIPENDAERLDALRRLEVLDTSAEERFDRITRIAQRYFGVPIALVSLVDRDRQWFKSRQGLDACETDRSVSFCGHAILDDDILYIPNALDDPRFADNPLVTGGPEIRFYAGAPLHAPDGHRVGTLCVIDGEPHSLSADDLGVLRDLADSIEAELARTDMLHIQQQLYAVTAQRQAVLDSANFSIISTDIDGTIRTFNRGAERMLGYQADEMIGKQTPAIIHVPEEVVARTRELSRELGRNVEPGFETFVAKARLGVADEREWTYVRKDGTRFPVLLSVTAVKDASGTIDAFLGIASDITERKKLERLKSEFVSTVSHELRTPLTSIRGVLGLVLGGVAGELPAKAREMLEMAERNSERLTNLINDILDLERIESGRLQFDFKPADLIAIARQAIADNEGYARRHNVRLELQAECEGAPVRADVHRLLQVFANLISNAVKYSPEGEVVTVSVARCGDGFQVRVHDRGAGIPEEFRHRIYQRFAQADSSDSRQKGGTGLGLSISKGIVERHGGSIDYSTEVGAGTVFHFELPGWPRSDQPSAPSPGAPRLLICEDNPAVAAALRELLATEGLICEFAASAAQTRSMIASASYQALLLDLSLPDADGLALIQELRSQPISRELPIIVLSARAEEGKHAWSGDAMAVVDWLQKPVDAQRLALALRQALRRTPRPLIFHVEDDLDIIQITKMLVAGLGEYRFATSLAEARSWLAQHTPDLLLLDLSLPDGGGLELIDMVKGRAPVVVFSAAESCTEISEQVAAALTKSRTSNEQFLETIRRFISRVPPA